MYHCLTDVSLSHCCFPIDRCGPSPFGKKAAHNWARLMQRAEGPEAFEAGYLRMQRIYSGDADKLEYIEELYNDDDKAHFKGDLPFTNGVLVDMCEVLFNATKVWVWGNGRNKRTRLLMAVVRIITGCYNMMMVAFVVPVTSSRKKCRSKNKYVAFMFKEFTDKMTAKACQDMFDSLDRVWAGYTIRSDLHHCCEMMSEHGDVFLVTEDFKCSCEGKPCWQQSHSGLLCGHALRACVHRLQQAQTRPRRESIVTDAIGVCDSNWFRSTYSVARSPTSLPQPVSPLYPEATRAACPRWQDYIQRFHVVARFLSPKLIEEHLHSMERAIYTHSHSDREISHRVPDATSSTSSSHPDSDGSDETSSSSDIPEIVVSNPRKRVRKNRRQYMNNNE